MTNTVRCARHGCETRIRPTSATATCGPCAAELLLGHARTAARLRLARREAPTLADARQRVLRWSLAGEGALPVMRAQYEADLAHLIELERADAGHERRWAAMESDEAAADLGRREGVEL